VFLYYAYDTCVDTDLSWDDDVAKIEGTLSIDALSDFLTENTDWMDAAIEVLSMEISVSDVLNVMDDDPTLVWENDTNHRLAHLQVGNLQFQKAYSFDDLIESWMGEDSQTASNGILDTLNAILSSVLIDVQFNLQVDLQISDYNEADVDKSNIPLTSDAVEVS